MQKLVCTCYVWSALRGFVHLSFSDYGLQPAAMFLATVHLFSFGEPCAFAVCMSCCGRGRERDMDSGVVASSI